MKILELFSGYGTASFALKRIGMDYELVGYSDIDKYANQCFKQNHCPDDKDDKLRLGDVTKINPNELEDFDLLTGGFPCQAFSNAGNMKGELDPRGTLFNEIIRIAEVKQPKYMLLENVKGFTFKKFKDTFDKVLSELDRIGYVVYWKVLNSKDFGVPQNRERVWFVCFRKDVEHSFEFPEQRISPCWINFVDNSKYFKKVNKTPSRDIMRNKCKNITNLCVVGTISTKQDRFPNAGIIDCEDYYRFLTINEQARLMGFFNDEINLDNLSHVRMEKLLGNGQDVNVVTLLFKQMFGGKKWIDKQH